MAKELGRSDQQPTHEEIAKRAYALFEQSGRQPGHDQENWLKAEAQLMASRKQHTEAKSNSAVMARPVVRQHINSRA